MINIVELLKDCPSGMELDCTMYENLEFDYIDEKSAYPIKCREKITDVSFNSYEFTKDGKPNHYSNAKCVIFPKGKTTWEEFTPSCQFKDGDIVFYDNCVSIFKEWGDETLFRNYVKVDIDGRYPMLCDKTHSNGKGIKREARFATEEEKEKLFKAIKDNNYRWNPETKTLLSKFKDGDIVTSLNTSIYILTEHHGYFFSPCGLIADHKGENHRFKVGAISISVNTMRLATEEEKQKLFDAIKANGYRWNADTKTLDKLVERKFKVGDSIREKNNKYATFTISDIDDSRYYCGEYVICNICYQDNWELVPNKFDINTLKPFDKVLVRDFDNGIWDIEFFSRLFDGKHFKCLDLSYVQCIPYENNQHLLGTTNDCDDFYKTWE